MNWMRSAVAVVGISGWLAAAPAQASPVVLGFEGLADSELLLTQIPGLSFANAMVLTAGVSLNEFEFPPASGVNVLVDDTGPIEIRFDLPMVSVGGAFTYNAGMTLSAYDSADQLLGQVRALYGSNLALSGDPGSAANEFISFGDAAGRIARVVFEGSSSGGSLVLDNLTVDRGLLTVPEPSSLALAALVLATGLVPGGWLRRRRPQ